MGVSATYDYQYPARDAVANFGGVQLTYVYWDNHLTVCAPAAFPLPPDMPLGALVEQVIPGVYSFHPDWAKIDWPAVEWSIDGERIVPDLAKSLKENGLNHKSMLTFKTPGLRGLSDSGA
jgi:phenol hydroxylase P4 protein